MPIEFVNNRPVITIGPGGTGGGGGSGLPDQTGHANDVLTTDGTNASWTGDAAINITGNSANVTGVVAISNGGTGQTTASNAINALLPSQTGHNTHVLTTDGSTVSWVASASSTPGGSNGQVQYNNSGAFGGAAAVTYSTSGSLLTVTAQAASDKPLIVKGAASQSGNLQEWQNNSAAVILLVDASGIISAGAPAAGAGNSITVRGSSAVSGDTNGGNVVLTPGALSGAGVDGNVTITRGQLLVKGDGSPSVPPLANSNDIDTGIYFPGTNQIGLVCNGILRLNVSGTAIAADADITGTGDCKLRSGGNFTFSSSPVSSGPTDVGFKRSSAGIAQVTDGSTGIGGLIVGAAVNTNVCLTVKGIASQSANLQEWQNSSSVVQAAVTPNGQFLGRGTMDYSQPEFAFASDLNTGIAWRSADTFSFIANALEQVRITDSAIAGVQFYTRVKMDSHYGDITADTDGATITFNMLTSDKHTVTLGGNRTLAVTNDEVGQTFLIILKQDGTGGRTVTWFSNILWQGGSVPVLTATADKIDVFSFLKIASNSYLGFVVGQNY
jgi:hypothetical protein